MLESIKRVDRCVAGRVFRAPASRYLQSLNQGRMLPMSEVAEHPKSSAATVRELYAHAFTCARQDRTE